MRGFVVFVAVSPFRQFQKYVFMMATMPPHGRSGAELASLFIAFLTIFDAMGIDDDYYER